MCVIIYYFTIRAIYQKYCKIINILSSTILDEIYVSLDKFLRYSRALKRGMSY